MQQGNSKNQRIKFRRRSKSFLASLVIACSLLMIAGAVVGFLAHSASEIKRDLASARELLPQFHSKLIAKDRVGAEETLQRLQEHTGAAKERATSVVWKMAGAFPFVGSNFSTVAEIALSAEDLAEGAAKPLLDAYSSLDWNSLTPNDGKFDVSRLEEASPAIVTAANTVDLTYTRLAAIPRGGLLQEVSGSLDEATATLDNVHQSLNIAADASQVLPSMLGSKEPRNYLLLVQNNAEIRATGGLPGALAVLRFDDGKVELTEQSSGAALGKFVPPVQVDPSQSRIYTSRLGAYISDVNLTPDFPTAAGAAKAMWEKRHNTVIDGVLAIDPIVLSHLLEATGPIQVPADVNAGTFAGRLPETLSASNVVHTLLSESYATINDLVLQDDYFAAVAQATFEALAIGKAPAEKVIQALVKSSSENRILIWSDRKDEQKILSATPLSGSISGPGGESASFGVYFNDGTGAKMDYYMRRNVQLLEVCTNNEYAEFKVRIRLTNIAPLDAATSLPVAVTGGGLFGVPAGTVQTNVVVYGPAQSYVDTALRDGLPTEFGAHLHSGRPVGTLTTRVPPGQNAEVEMTFVKVVQQAEPTLSVTPTLEDVNDVTLPTKLANCGKEPDH